MSFVIYNIEGQAQIDATNCPASLKRDSLTVLTQAIGFFCDALMEANVLGQVRGCSRCETEERLPACDA